MYPQSVLALHLKWDVFFEKLLAVRKINVTDEHAKELINALDTIEIEGIKLFKKFLPLFYK